MLNVKKTLTKILSTQSINVASYITDGTVTVSAATLYLMLGRIAILYITGKANTSMSAGTLYTACTVASELYPLTAAPAALSGNGSGSLISNGTLNVRPQSAVTNNANAYLITGTFFLKTNWGGVIRTLKNLLCITLNERGCAVC